MVATSMTPSKHDREIMKTDREVKNENGKSLTVVILCEPLVLGITSLATVFFLFYFNYSMVLNLLTNFTYCFRDDRTTSQMMKSLEKVSQGRDARNHE